MQWIKASERLPVKDKVYVVKNILTGEYQLYWLRTLARHKSFYFWLDESVSPSVVGEKGKENNNWDLIFDKYAGEVYLNLEEVRYFFIPFLNWLKKNFPNPVGEKEENDLVAEKSNSDLAEVATLRSSSGNSIELSKIIGMSSGGIKAWEDLGSDRINPEGLVDILIEIKAIAEKLKLSSLQATIHLKQNHEQ